MIKPLTNFTRCVDWCSKMFADEWDTIFQQQNGLHGGIVMTSIEVTSSLQKYQIEKNHAATLT